MNLKALTRRWLRATGIDIVQFDPATHALARRLTLVQKLGIDLVLDVGANRGQYARQLRNLGYRGRIISWEPSSTAYAELQRAAARDRHWDIRKSALSDNDTMCTLHVSRNDCSNSLLPMLPRHEQAAPDSVYERTESVQVERLDTVFGQCSAGARRVFLKVDAQGSEKSVLEGAKETLRWIELIQLEVSLVPLYAGETLLPDMVRYLADRHYEVVSIEPGYLDRSTGRMLQADLIFARQESAA